MSTELWSSMLEQAGGMMEGDFPEALRVLCGRHWVYPRFQFPQPGPEMGEVLKSLPDDFGWDRLHWFLTPHVTLNGQTPLEVWKSDRAKVIAAARTERWDGRD